MSEDRGIKVGTNLNTDTAFDLKLTSQFSSLKLYKWKNAQFTTDGSGNGSVEIPHDLGYVPIVQVWGKHTASFPFLSATTYPNAYSLLDNGLNSYRPYGSGIVYFADNEKITVRAVAIGGIGGGVEINTTYYFRVLIWVDLSEAFIGSSNIALTGDRGFKVSNPGKDVLTGKEYEMAYSSKYKAIQYYENHIQSSSLTLPAMWASVYDDEVQEATYVDFNHNLGYPPMFLVYSNLGTAYLYEAPYSAIDPYLFSYQGLEEVSAWCDSSRVRVLFHRESVYQTGSYGTVYPAKTISVHVVMFTENLAGSESP